MKKILVFILLSVLAFNFVGCNKPNAQTNGNSEITEKQKTDTSNNPTFPEKALKSEFRLLDGKKTTIEAYKGKVLIVNVWGTWCPPCRAEIPELIKMQEEFGEKGLQIVGLSTSQGAGDEPDAVVKAFAENQKINYDIGFSTPEIQVEMSKMAQRGAVPMSFVLNRESKVIGIFTGFNPQTTPPKLRQTVEKALAL